MSSLYYEYGGLQLPVDSTDVSDDNLTSALDPLKDAMLSLFKDAINFEIGGSTSTVTAGSVWGAVRTGTAVSGALPVADTLWTRPHEQIMKEVKFNFPLLALYRTTAEFEDFLLGRERLVQQWSLDYILPPLNGADERRLGSIVDAVPKIVSLVLKNRGHASHQSGTNVFGDDAYDLAMIKMVGYQTGIASFNQQQDPAPYLACQCGIETWEVQSAVTGAFGDFDGANIHAGVGSNVDVVADVVNARTDVLPVPSHGKPKGS